MKVLQSLLPLLFLLSQVLYAQTSLSGIINDYTAVTAIDYCAAKLTVADASAFSEGQAILLIQMQGAAINESNSASFGNITDIGQAGRYERARIQAIAGNELFLEHELVNTYSIPGKVQLVSIPEYEDAIVSAPLTAQAWNGATGGILALEVSGTLSLQAPVHADGKGFRGGQVQVVNSNCQWFLSEDDYYYNESNWRGARKGEGAAAFISGKEKGRGAQANGGGGGNDHNAGGGGGGQLSAGGQGGLNTPSSSFGCDGDFPGLGGKSLPASPDRLFPGGGGGAGHANDPGTGSSGGNGGGIVLIWAGAIDGQGQQISANGLDVPQATGDGAGGGGAGGAVVLWYQTALSPFQVDLRGGNGGNTQNFSDRCYAPGGGGSGGRFLRNGPSPATLILDGGQPGVNTVASTSCNTPQNGATVGSAGQEALISSFPQGNTPVIIPAITQQNPAMLTVCPGQAGSLTLSASGNNLSYQWQADTGAGFADLSDGPLYTGTQSPVLQLSDPQTGWAGYQYRCIISSPCFAPLTSPVTTLQVESLATAAFSFSVNGTEASFQNMSANADSLTWDFGDGNQSALTDPVHVYNMEGSYTVTLTAFNACGAVSVSQTIAVGFPPAAGFGADFTAGCTPLTVQFSDLSAGNGINEWNWSFPGGEPASSSLPDPVVTYQTPGTWDVTLIVANDVASDTLTLPAFIEVVPFPEAGFTYTLSGDTAFFTNQSTGINLNYNWDFGDGAPASNATNPVHVFPGPGTYEVTLLALTTYCADGASQILQVGPSSASDREAMRGVRFFPNPFETHFFMENRTNERIEVRIRHADGAFLEKRSLGPGLHAIDLSDWPAGMYVVEWQTGKGIFAQRLVKTRS